MHPAWGEGCGDHLHARSHYLGGLSCGNSCLWLHLLHLWLNLWRLNPHRCSNQF